MNTNRYLPSLGDAELQDTMERIYRNNAIGTQYNKAKEEAEEEYKKIEDSSKATVTDLISSTVGINTKDPIDLYVGSIMQNGLTDTVKRMSNINNKHRDTLLNAYNETAKRLANDTTTEDYYRDRILLNRISKELGTENQNYLSFAENAGKSYLKGIQGFVANTENALLAKGINNQAMDTALDLAMKYANGGVDTKKREELKDNIYNTARKYLTGEGEQQIQRQQQLNDISYNGLSKLALQGAYTIGDMTVPILAGWAAGAGTGSTQLAEAANLGAMYTGVYGNSYKEAKDMGANSFMADLYANAIANVEVATELIGGETMLSFAIGRPATTLLGKLSSGTVGKVRNRAAKAVLTGLIDVGGESLEEFIAGLADPVIKKSILGGENLNTVDILQGAYEDAVGAIIPSLIFMGVGRPTVIAQVNAQEAKTLSDINKATYLTPEQKGDLTRKIKEATADARLGINENYDKIYNAVYGEMEASKLYNDLIDNQVTRTGMQYGATEGAMDLMRQEMGFINNTANLTTQEILDTTQPTVVEYNGMKQINEELQAAMKDNSAIKSVTVKEDITRAQQNLKDIIEKLTGKQVVYVDVDSVGETDRGFTSPGSNNIYINASSNMVDSLNAAYHEIGHHYKTLFPELYTEFVKASNYDRSVTDYEKEEDFGDYIARIMSKAENVKSVEASTRTVFDNLKDVANRVSSALLGTERNNTRVSAYNLDNISYLGPDILNNQALEQNVLNAFNNLQNQETGTRENTRFSKEKRNGKNKQTTNTESVAKATEEEKIIDNQRNEISKLTSKSEELKEENKGLKKIIKGIKTTGRARIKEVQSESNKMLKTGRETEIKLKGELEREGKKYSTLSKLATDIKFENQLERKARADGITYGREYKDLFIGLRRAGDTIEQAYNTTKMIYDESQRVNKAIDESMAIINGFKKRGVYNKLPNDIKKKIDAYDKFWTKSRQQSDLTLAKRILESLEARSLIGKVALSRGVRNKIMSMEGYGWENGKGSVSFEEYFGNNIQVAEQFLTDLKKLQTEVEEFQARNLNEERTQELAGITEDIAKDVEKEEQAQDKLKTKQFVKKFTNKTLANSQMTLKTEIQATMGGNAKTPLMIINSNLQDAEIRRKQAIVDIYNLLNEFRTKSSGLNRLIGSVKWNKTIEKALAINSDWTNTGIKVDGKELRLPRSMMMSLAMHLLNDQNMQHISGGVVAVEADENGNVNVKFKNGEGMRVPNEQLYKKNKGKEAYDRGKTVKLSQDQVKQIVSQLTEDEQAFVEATREVFKYTTKLINEVSNRIFGYDIATVENYFPIHVWSKGEATGAVMKSLTSGNYSDALNYLLNPGWLEQRVSSFEPIYLENIAEVMNRSVSSVARFYGYAEALRDNNIILNGVMPDGTQIVKGLNYLSSDFMKDYNKLTRFIVGLDNTKSTDTFRKFMAANTLTFNIGTWLTQPMSFFNTLKYYTGSQFMKGVNPFNNHVVLNNMVRNYYKTLGLDTSQTSDAQLFRMFIAEATPFLDYRSIGYKMTGIDKLLTKNINDKIGAKGIQLFDDLAVTAIARMQAYVLSLDPTLKFGSEEYFKRLGSNLTQVLSETQPEYSEINRSNMFRSNNTLMRTLSLFGTPANQMFNNFLQSAMDLRYNVRTKNKAGIKSATNTLAKSIGGIIGSSIGVALIRALRDSIRAKDDDDTEFADRVIAQFTVAMLSPTLIGDDIASYIMSNADYGGASSFDFSTPDTTFVNGLQTLANSISSLTKEGVSPTKKVVNVVKAIGTVTPVDTRSLVRMTEAMMKFVSPDMYNAYTLQNNSTIYKKWAETSNTDMAQFYKAYTATRNANLEANYGYHKADKENNIKSNLKESREKALKDVLGNQKDVDAYMEILFGYKKGE